MMAYPSRCGSHPGFERQRQAAVQGRNIVPPAGHTASELGCGEPQECLFDRILESEELHPAERASRIPAWSASKG
jgi:hypothetical protein